MKHEAIGYGVAQYQATCTIAQAHSAALKKKQQYSDKQNVGDAHGTVLDGSHAVGVSGPIVSDQAITHV